MAYNILDLFYDFVVKEALTGRVDCFFKYNLIFNTYIAEEHIHLLSQNDNSNLMIPTLMIQDKKMFDRLLSEYVEKALSFYGDDCFVEEIRNLRFSEEDLGVSKEKLILTLLWSNATIEDFNDPCNYLRKRIQFFQMDGLEKYLEPNIIGYSEVLGANIEVQLLKNRLESETPYSVQIFLRSVEENKRIYEFPRVYVGLSDGMGYIYAIQNSRTRMMDERNHKMIERKLYRVHAGLDVNEDTYENYGMGNLKDITPSFLVAANVVMGILHNSGISKVDIPSILISRWNGKVLTLDYQAKRLKSLGLDDEAISEQLGQKEIEYLRIQSNLTEKFLRIFRRIGYHHSSIAVTSYPGEIHSSLQLKIYDMEDICSNQLLSETYSFGSLENNRKK